MEVVFCKHVYMYIVALTLAILILEFREIDSLTVWSLKWLNKELQLFGSSAFS